MVRILRKPMNVSPYLPELSARQFTWTGNVGVAEASDFGTLSSIRARVWLDSCDEGFWLRSPKTGERILFTFDDVEREATLRGVIENHESEGEIVAWRFTSYGTSETLTIKVHND